MSIGQNFDVLVICVATHEKMGGFFCVLIFYY